METDLVVDMYSCLSDDCQVNKCRFVKKLYVGVFLACIVTTTSIFEQTAGNGERERERRNSTNMETKFSRGEFRFKNHQIGQILVTVCTNQRCDTNAEADSRSDSVETHQGVEAISIFARNTRLPLGYSPARMR